jgi:polyferredoxin
VLVYAVLLATILGASIWSLATRTPVIVDVLRDRNAIYRDAGPDHIENVYRLKIGNQLEQPRAFTLSVSGIDGVRLREDLPRILVEPGAVKSLAVGVLVPREQASGIRDILFTVTSLDADQVVITETSRFIGPMPR